jgi:lipopolysaccharide biosynthesis regulator YciM
MHKFTVSALCACSILLMPAAAITQSHAAAQDVATANADEVAMLKAYFKQGDFNYVVESLEPVEGKSPEQHNMLISALMNIDLDDAEEAAEQFIQDYSDNYKAYHTHASVMGAQASSSIFSALGYAKKAKNSLEKAVEIAPGEIAVYQALMQFHLMAPSIAGGDMDEAMTLAQTISKLDATEGQFALARIYLEEDKQAEAEKIFSTLIDNDSTQIRARLELGSFYLGDEQYAASYDTLLPLSTTDVAAVSKADSEAWDTYQKRKANLMYGKYRLGQVAVESGDYTDSGINALKSYLEEYQVATIDTEGLPGANWAQLRLAELLLNADKVNEAQNLVEAIKEEKDERFAKTLKKIKKALKKRAAV